MAGKASTSIILVAVILATPCIVLAQSAEELQSQINSHQAQIESLNKEIAQYEKDLVQIGSTKQTLQAAVNALDISVKQTQAKVKAKQAQIATTELQIQQLGGDIANKEELIQVDSAAIGETIRSLHESDQATMIEILLANPSIADVWDDTENTRVIQDSMHDHVENLLVVKDQLTVDKTATEKKKGELEQQRRDLSAEEQSLAVQKKEQQGILTQTKNQEANYQKLLTDKRTAKASFEAALDDLESKLEYTRDPSHIPAVGKGVLRWPLDNISITQQFGRTADSGRLYSSGSHNGVDFRASIGTPVKAALSGTVQGTGNTDSIPGCYSYGKWVLIKHGNGLTTLYAHLSQIGVSEGQAVSTGAVIGYSGFTGYATGPHLHLTLYASDAVKIQKLNSGKGCNNAVIPVSAASGYLNPLDYL